MRSLLLLLTCGVAGAALAAENPLPGDVVIPGVASPSSTPAASPTAEIVRMKTLDVIVLDEGHGGEETGTKSLSPPLLEKDVASAVAKKIEALLQAKTTARVVFTHTADTHADAAERGSFANQAHADLFLSLHANASPAPGARGFRVYYHDPGRVIPAPSLPGPAAGISWSDGQRPHEAASARVAELLRAALADKVTLPDGGVRHAPIAALEGVTCPAAMIELGFLTNHDDALALSTGAVQDAVAEAVLDAILKIDADLPPRTE